MPQRDGSIDLEYPFTGRWLTQNSPANRVPSHGTTLFGTSYAIDFVPVNDTGRTAPITFGSLVRPEPPERFPGFGRRVLAPIAGVVWLRTTPKTTIRPIAVWPRSVTR
jgi:hypothetical protein